MQVVKVMHGADWDIIWLQRDFGIYIASLFDTGQAARVLNHPRFGLGHMLEKLCKVKVCTIDSVCPLLASSSDASMLL